MAKTEENYFLSNAFMAKTEENYFLSNARKFCRLFHILVVFN